MSVRSTDVIFLLGAGASAEANIPTSADMVQKIERLIREDEGWREYDQLYYHIKSGIFYAAGLRGYFNESVQFNIETLVNTLYELERNEEHPLYPFIASMNSRLVSLAGKDFSRIREFRRMILSQLKQWMSPDNLSTAAAYYEGFRAIQRDLNFPLRIFTLNYDRCVERIARDDFRVETGFGGFGPDHPWSWERFDDNGSEVPQIYLYKLHGSIDWKRDPNTNRLYQVEQTASVEPDKMVLIFGREFKVETADPYLFYLYAFRNASYSASLIVLLGYGFGDKHINDLLVQALRLDSDRKLLVVDRKSSDPNQSSKRSEELASLLKVESDRIVVQAIGAKAFLEDQQQGRKLLEMVPHQTGVPF